jgi:hypothetical protein
LCEFLRSEFEATFTGLGDSNSLTSAFGGIPKNAWRKRP